MKLRIVLLASTIVFAATLPAFAAGSSNTVSVASGDVSARAPQTVLDALKREGYLGTLSKLDSGRPSIAVKVAGVETYIDFYDCAADMTNCDTLLFNVTLEIKDGVTLAQANNWNGDQITGRVSIDKSENPTLGYAVSTFSGISEDTFDQTMKLWDTKIGDFKSFFHF